MANEGSVYTDAVISQVGVGCLEFTVLRKGDKEIQQITVYSQRDGAGDKWGKKIYTGSLPELIEYIAQANTAINILTQIGDMVNKRT